MSNLTPDPYAFYQEQWKKQIVMLYAGCKAVQIKTNDDEGWTGFEISDYHYEVADYSEGSDEDLITDLVYFIDPSSKVNYLGRANKLLRDHWPKVEPVAAALLGRKTLKYDEVRKLAI